MQGLGSRRILNIRLFPLLFIFMAMGIVVALYTRAAITIAISIALFLSLIGLLILLRKRSEYVVGIILCLVFYGLGVALILINIDVYMSRLAFSNCDIQATVYVSNVPDEAFYDESEGKYISLTLSDMTVNGNRLEGYGLYSATISSNPDNVYDYRSGITLMLSGATLSRIDPISENSLYCKGYRYRIRGGETRDSRYTGVPFDISIRNRVRERLTVWCGARNAGILYCLLFGEKDYIDHDFYTAFVTLGLAHIFAVSGLHVGIVYSAILLLLRLFKTPDILSQIISAVGVVLFAALCGFSVSVTRATIFILMHAVCRIAHRRYDPPSVWSLSAIFLLCICPYYLINTSFLLSFGSILSIMLLYRSFYDVVGKGGKMPEYVRQIISLQAAISIGMTPLNVALFSRISVLSLPVNMIAVPLFSIVYVVILVAVMLTYINPLFGVALKPISYLMSAFTHLMDAVNLQRWRINADFDIWICLLFGAACFAGSQYMLIDKKYKNAIVIGLSSLIFVTILVGLLI